MTCARCSRPHDNWPDAQSDGCLCQECWEAQCSREWWAVVRMMDAAGLMEPAAEADQETSIKVRPHWRSGHWHTVRHGKGKEHTRTQWYRPTYVNADQAA